VKGKYYYIGITQQKRTTVIKMYFKMKKKMFTYIFGEILLVDI